ncbi:penicillin-binding transpeptidase domain-containing protein [Gilvimarinus sp. SDUM040013]|uniref:Penicillin-binding transpeptidase domain-containing protein n=1 Tax=Gilvimarinus gilvus TaxID=3058038 RepID=A0ABU4S0D4_9GAMM|nr:penicillin-binding transpeptidase domain-containing protein [Gilvimarinus sp. SDUM040013]MDO3385882.1 penicillin-binding transpeptidase domain-containing protein [Gilvimarinus sp. SDUM040013]MDX6850615.1 penicillin-binding transpeptidase domain-containing protein [Gilvimarinus sp. SDUM040013]
MLLSAFHKFKGSLWLPGILLIMPFSSITSAQTLRLCEQPAAQCTAIIYHESSNTSQYYNTKRSQERFSPFSTFKVPNSVIFLEEGLVNSFSQMLDFDRAQYPPEGWWPESWQRTPMTFRQALQRSAVPIYRSLSSEVGAQKMAKWLETFDYGNQDISAGIDTFWLGASLKISAREQIQFLRRLRAGEFNVREASLAALQEMMLVEKREDYLLYAKTGAGNLPAGGAIGWYVGWLDRGTDRQYFALNVSAATFSELLAERATLIELLVQELTDAPSSHWANRKWGLGGRS